VLDLPEALAEMNEFLLLMKRGGADQQSRIRVLSIRAAQQEFEKCASS
jgi:hypothetical protein